MNNSYLLDVIANLKLNFNKIIIVRMAFILSNLTQIFLINTFLATIGSIQIFFEIFVV